MIDPPVRLRRAIHLKDTVLVKRIIQAHPKLLQNPDFDDRSNTSLHLAAHAGLVEITDLLLDAGHEKNEISRNADWETPLMLAARNGHNEVGKMLIERCPRCIPWTNKLGMDALALSCLNQPSTPLVALLLSNAEYPASPHSRDSNGNTPLHHASASGSLKALRILLTAGADPAAKNAYDWDPLAYSQTVAAEVYFKTLIAEFERRKAEGAQEHKEWKEELGRRKGAGVRMITDDAVAFERSSDTTTSIWTAVDPRNAMTPTAARSGGRVPGFEGPRTRAGSGA